MNSGLGWGQATPGSGHSVSTEPAPQPLCWASHLGLPAFPGPPRAVPPILPVILSPLGLLLGSSSDAAEYPSPGLALPLTYTQTMGMSQPESLHLWGLWSPLCRPGRKVQRDVCEVPLAHNRSLIDAAMEALAVAGIGPRLHP